MKAEIWNNLNGYFWTIGSTAWEATNNGTHKTARSAAASAKRFARRLGCHNLRIVDATRDPATFA